MDLLDEAVGSFALYLFEKLDEVDIVDEARLEELEVLLPHKL